MAAPGWRRLALLFSSIVVSAAALWQISLFVRLHVARHAYAWDIEWLEGAALYQAQRVMEGKVTYGPPKIGYLPLFHPPAYPALLGLVGKVWKIDYSVARDLSFAFISLAGALAAWALWRHHHDDDDGKSNAVTLGLLSAGIAAAGVPLTEGFYDLVREDSLAVLLCALCAFLADAPEKKLAPRRIALLAAVITAIVYTRLPAVFFPVWVTVWIFARHRKSGLWLALAGVAGCGLVLVALLYTSRGWYWIYTVSLLQDHAVPAVRFWEGVGLLRTHMAFTAVIPVLAIVLAATRSLSARGALWLGMWVCSIPASMLPFAKVGGYLNDFIPYCFFSGPAAAFLIADGARALSKRPALSLSLRGVLHAGLCAHLIAATYGPERLAPDAKARKRVRDMNAFVAKLEGGVLAPRHPFVPVQNGSPSDQFADMPYLDMWLAGYTDLALGPYIDRIRAKYVLVNGFEVPVIAGEIGSRYQIEKMFHDPPRMIIGMGSSFRYLLRKADDERNGRVLFDFEAPLVGWTATGDAFSEGLTNPTPRGTVVIRGGVGQGLVSSYTRRMRDAAKGTLTSPPFTIDRPKLSLRVGGAKPGTRVELHVDGNVERKTSGVFDGSETLIKVVWDVAPWKGKEARLVLIDDSVEPWGHLLLDHVVLYGG